MWEQGPVCGLECSCHVWKPEEVIKFSGTEVTGSF